MYPGADDHLTMVFASGRPSKNQVSSVSWGPLTVGATVRVTGHETEPVITQG
jgi:hypothetical protein